MSLPESPESLFDKAYRGVYENIGMKEYSERILLKEERGKGSSKGLAFRTTPKHIQRGFWGWNSGMCGVPFV